MEIIFEELNLLLKLNPIKSLDLYAFGAGILLSKNKK